MEAREETSPHRTGTSVVWVGLVAAVVVYGCSLRVWYANAGLHPSRFFDERYSVANLMKVVEAGRLEIANGYYPTLTYLPQAVLVGLSERAYSASGDERFRMIDETGLLPRGRLVSRLVQVGYAGLTLLVVFLAGRRLFSEPVGFLAAILVASAPLHLRLSANFKPDVVLTLTTLVTTYWSVLAIERRRPRSFVLAGAGTALAASAKLTGVVTVLPLAVVALAVGWRDWRTWRNLALAGLASAGLFLLLNPHWPKYLTALERVQRFYDRTAATRGVDAADIPRLGVRYLLSADALGPVIGLLALIGAVGLLGRLLARRSSDPQTVALTTFFLFPLLFAAAYASSTPHFKGNNFLPLLPFMALLAAWVGVGGYRAAGRHIRSLSRPTVAGVTLAVAVLAIARPGFSYTYDRMVPSTYDRAAEFFRYQFSAARTFAEESRTVVAEAWAYVPRSWELSPPEFNNAPSMTVELDDPRTAATARLDRFDGELYRDDPSGQGDQFVDRRVNRVDSRYVARFEAVPFRVRGPSLTAIAHPWRLSEQPVALPAEHDVGEVNRFPVPSNSDTREQEVLSFALFVPGKRTARPVARIGDQVLPLFAADWSSRGTLFVSERNRYRLAGLELRVELGEDEVVPTLSLYRWRRRQWNR